MISLFLFFVFLFGLIIGSFLNCLIWRLHTKESMAGRSHCPKCLQKIFWYDNIPLCSFAFLGGKCRHCREKISWQYPAVELVTGILFVATFLVNFQLSTFNFQLLDNSSLILLFRDWFIIAIMVIIFIFDLRWYLVLDVVTLPACAIIFLLNLALGITWQNMAISGIIGGGFFLIQFLISRGKWIGGGDIRLGLLMGLIFGWPLVLIAIFLAYLIGSLVGVALILFKQKQWGSQIPLGIFLSTATVITLFWGEQILNWYLNLF